MSKEQIKTSKKELIYGYLFLIELEVLILEAVWIIPKMTDILRLSFGMVFVGLMIICIWYAQDNLKYYYLNKSKMEKNK